MKFDPDKNVTEILSECLQEIPFLRVIKNSNPICSQRILDNLVSDTKSQSL